MRNLISVVSDFAHENQPTQLPKRPWRFGLEDQRLQESFVVDGGFFIIKSVKRKNNYGVSSSSSYKYE